MNLIVALSACPSVGEIIENNLQMHESSHVNNKRDNKRGSLSRFIKNPFGRRNPSKMNLSSMKIVEAVIDDIIMENVMQEVGVTEDPVMKMEDKSVLSDNYADQIQKEDRYAIECHIDDIIQAACEAGKMDLESNSSKSKEVGKSITAQEVEGKDHEMSSQTTNKYETKLVSTESELTINVVPVTSRVKSIKIDTDSKLPKIMKTQQKLTHPYRRRIRCIKCNLQSKNFAAFK